MSVHLFDYQLLGDLFVTPEVRQHFDERAVLQAWLDVEAALADSEARVGLIPAWAAAEIAAQAQVDRFDLAALQRRVHQTAHPLVPLIEELARSCGQAGAYVHWGATTQDIIDTGMVLCLKRVYALITRDLAALIEVLAELAHRHRSTLMAGRTHGQHAAPITFGFKLAVWLAECLRHLDRLAESRRRALVGQLSGAVGTMAGFGPQAREIQRLALTRLGLAVPDIAWHSARDAVAEFVQVASLIGTSLGKFAHEIVTLQRTEIGEVEEPFATGKVGSSTMPHKRNPIHAETIVATSRLLRSRAALALEAMGQVHERDGTAWLTEWAFVPEAACLAASIVANTLHLVRGLTVHDERMAANAAILGEQLCSEALMLELARTVGRQTAHEIVYEAAMQAAESAPAGQAGGAFRQRLIADERVRAPLAAHDLDRLTEPARHLGAAEVFVDEIVIKARRAVASVPPAHFSAEPTEGP
ncbi:MAG TPA: adenylosuccinate lyase [Burkholderiaceae bacterium]|nr:adenylosuccinate lyase [Burkholderiaceae bacterium]